MLLAFLSGSPVLLFLRLFLVYHLVQVCVAMFLNLDALHSWSFVKRSREGSANQSPGLAWVLRYYILATSAFLILVMIPWWVSFNLTVTNFLVQYSPSLSWLPHHSELTSILVDLLLGLVIYKTLIGIRFALAINGISKLRDFMEFLTIRWLLFPLRLVTFGLFWLVGLSWLKSSSDSFQQVVRPRGNPESDLVRELVLAPNERAWVFSRASRPSDLFLAVLLGVFFVVVYRPDYSLLYQLLLGGWAFCGFIFLLGALDAILFGEHEAFFLEGFFSYWLVEKITPYTDETKDE